jgi:hypothetical protein
MKLEISEDLRSLLNDNHRGGIIVQLRRNDEHEPRYWSKKRVILPITGGYWVYSWEPLGNDVKIFLNTKQALDELGQLLDADFDLNGVSFLTATDFI